MACVPRRDSLRRRAARFKADLFGTAAIIKEYTVSTQQPEDSETGKGGAPDATPTELSASGLSRRGFAKLGAGAGGVLLTLASQPGMAQSVCASPSQSLSKWKSTHTGQQLQCRGLSPGYWEKPSTAGRRRARPAVPA